ncbi:MAG: hypothetical protein HY939_05520 [Gammaproteobacteria bacterium]|nr:hypothetical protein [Gammaproteobacteria bacterium]
MKHSRLLSLLFTGTLFITGHAQASVVSVTNRTPFHFTGSLIHFFNFREHFSIPAAIGTETLASTSFEDGILPPDFLLSTASRTAELCYFSSIESDFVVEITYNGCDATHPTCTIHCEARTDNPDDGLMEDEVTLSYEMLR